MTYLSHPVRRLREDPIAGEDVTLVVRAADGTDLNQLETAIGDAGGTVDERLQFESVRVTIAQEELDALCSVSGIAAIETDNVAGVGGDAGEDVG